ncbi:MAG: prephenate dehydrogenase/arogenate dehydrogenase family protein [Candidatus Eisenbacteria bacterium]|nr:prephenate dehydrogenase/arogenate dehydrogenase family protein [Candidatus Eisenbacteria bacterium]
MSDPRLAARPIQDLRVGVAGLGLIGASIGLGLRQAGVRVLGFDPDDVARSVARDRGAADRLCDGPRELSASVDVLFLAAPPSANVRMLEDLAGAPATLLITDTGSVKRAICATGARLFAARGGARFVGGHPMAGSESSGPAAARADLFAGAPWYLCAPAGPLPELEPLVDALGAVTFRADPDAHDRMAASLSHLPQLLAWLLRNDWGREGLVPAQGGPVARELARLARSSPGLWADILTANRDHVAAALRRVAGGAAALADCFDDPDPERALRALEDLCP